MTITLLFLAGIMATVIGWLLKQTLNTTPWISEAADDAVSGTSLNTHNKTLGLAVFLAVATSLFALLISAYNMRMHMADWRPLAEPNLLWINTGVLVLASVVYQLTRAAAVRGSTRGVRFGLALAGLLSILFLVGQWTAWLQLQSSGQIMTRNPANAFFYLLTAVHALHMLGGLWVWGRSALRVFAGADAESVRLSVELCTVYWHFLLLVWAVLFGMLLAT